MTSIMDPNQFKRMLTDRVRGDDWWVFVPVDSFAEMIEERFYSGDATGDFEVAIGPAGVLFADPDVTSKMLTVAFGRRRRLPAATLTRLLNQRRASGVPKLTPAQIEERPLLFVFEEDSA